MTRELELKLIEVEGFIKGSVGKKIRYREDGNRTFTDDIVKDCIVEGSAVTVIMQNESILTSDVNEISITKYDDREDIFIYGDDKCNRFNVYY